MILSLSALLGSNYFQLRLFSVSDMTYLSNNPRWMFLLGTYPASPCTPVNFLHPIFLQASAAVDLLWTWLMTFLSFLGWTRSFNKFSPPFQCTQGFVNLFKIPLACLFSWLKHPNPLGWFLWRSHYIVFVVLGEPFPAVFLLPCTAVALQWHCPWSFGALCIAAMTRISHVFWRSWPLFAKAFITWTFSAKRQLLWILKVDPLQLPITILPASHLNVVCYLGNIWKCILGGVFSFHL